MLSKGLFTWDINFLGLLYNRLGGLNRKNLLPHSPQGQKSKIKMLSGLAPSEAMKENLHQTTLLATGDQLDGIFGVL